MKNIKPKIIDTTLQFLLIGKNYPIIEEYNRKIFLGTMIFCTLFMWKIKNFFVALEHIGFIIFIVPFLYVVLSKYLGIMSHQQEQTRPNFKDRKHQRGMLLIYLVVFLEIITIPMLIENPYMFVMF